MVEKSISYSDKNKPDYVYKLLIVGDMCVGKTCFLLRYCDDVFNETHISTIGVDYRVKALEINNEKIRLQIWDTAGQDRFRSITRSYYKGSHGILLLFDCTKRESYYNVKSWVSQIIENAPVNSIVILVANKIDKESERVVSKEEAEMFANDKKLMYIECSALKSININECFNMLIKEIYEKGIVSSVKENRLKNLKEDGGSTSKKCCGK